MPPYFVSYRSGSCVNTEEYTADGVPLMALRSLWFEAAVNVMSSTGHHRAGVMQREDAFCFVRV